jgi:lipopolysaccharide biosynthesis regulator YciM
MDRILGVPAVGGQVRTIGGMWNPLTLPLAAVGALTAIPRGLAAVERGADLLEDALVQAAALNRRAEEILDELAAARETFAEAMLKLDRLSEQGDRVLGRAQHMIDAAHAARQQLEESQGELARANDQISKALDMAEPLDRMTTRAAKIAGSLRRDSGD